MLESAVGDGQEKLGFEQEVAEAGRVDADVRAPVKVRRSGSLEGLFDWVSGVG